MKTSESLSTTLTDVRRRLLAVGVAIGAGWAVVCAILFVLLWMWLDLALELTAGLRLMADVAALGLAAAILVLASGRNLRMGATLALAQRLDRAGGTRGQILTGADLMEGSAGMAVEGGAAVLAPGLAALAVERASELAAKVSRSLAVPARPLFWPVACFAFLAASITVTALAVPRLASTQWQRFADPFGDHPPYTPIWFEVEPKNVQVVYGDGLDVRAVAHDGVVEKVDLILVPADGSREEVLPMFPEPNGSWRAAVANVTAPQKYLVRAGRARSNRFDIGIITVPRFENVAFAVAPPAYTRQSAYEGPLPQGGLSGLPRTTVQVRVKSNRPLVGGVIEGTGFTGGSGFKVQGSDQRAAGFSPRGADASANDAQPGAGAPTTRPASLAMQPGSDPHEVIGTFVISGKGQASIHLTDVAGQKSRASFPFPITLLADERPFIRILEPEKESLATPDANVPVVLDAEDDYGISRVRLFRSLNDSRPLPMEVAVPKPYPTHWNGSAVLPLGECGLAPGDVIKLFARVEDNDPDGAKGSESTIVTIRVIAQEDYERLMQTKEGLEVLEAKYEMANRHMEALLDEINKLQKEIENEPPESPLSEEQQKKLEQLAKDFEKAAREIAKAADKKLPYDLDEKLSEGLKELADQMQEGAEQAKELADQKGQSASTLEKALRKLAEKAGADRKQFQGKAIKPLERLAAVYPLMEDQAMYTVLYQRQRDLAERAAALQGKDSVDDPDTKARMRDLEQEQHQIREALSQLLDSIEQHAAELPDDEEVQKLRATAQDFAAAVRDSGATDTQTEAESALTEFAGTKAAEKSKEAADIMEKFLKKCKLVGDEGQSACKAGFQPGIYESMGLSIDQLLSQAGLPKMGKGNGPGAGDGYSIQRTGLQNVGLYGNLPTMRDSREGNHGGKDARMSRPGNRTGARNEAAPLAGTPDMTGDAAGTSGVEVPVQYKQKVGRYMERIADELGDEDAKKGKK